MSMASDPSSNGQHSQINGHTFLAINVGPCPVYILFIYFNITTYFFFRFLSILLPSSWHVQFYSFTSYTHHHPNPWSQLTGILNHYKLLPITYLPCTTKYMLTLQAKSSQYQMKRNTNAWSNFYLIFEVFMQNIHYIVTPSYQRQHLHKLKNTYIQQTHINKNK